MSGLCAVLLAAATAGCAGDDDAYCATWEDRAAQLQKSATAPEIEADTVRATLTAFRRLQADAPENMATSWQTLVTAWQALDDALEAAGEEVGAAERSAIRAASEELRSTEVRQAAAGIEQHAREACGVDLAGSA